MNLRIPFEAFDSLRHLAVCVHFEQESAPDKYASLADSRTNVSAEVKEGGRRILLQTILDADGPSAHYHVEATVKEPNFQSTKLGTTSARLPEVIRVPKELSGVALSATVWARKRIAKGDLDKRGIIFILSDVRTSKGEYQLSFTGGSVDLRGDGPFIQMRWWDEGDDVEVELGAYTTVTIDGSLFTQASKLVEPGFDLLVLNSTSKRAKKKKAANEKPRKSRSSKG
jgi:hypothetical protein